MRQVVVVMLHPKQVLLCVPLGTGQLSVGLLVGALVVGARLGDFDGAVGDPVTSQARSPLLFRTFVHTFRSTND